MSSTPIPPELLLTDDQQPAPVRDGRGGRSLLGLFPGELEAVLAALGQPRYRARQLFHWMHQRAELDPARMSNLPAGLRERLKADWTISASSVERRLHSADGLTSKLLLKLADGQQIEVVEMNTAPVESTGCSNGGAGTQGASQASGHPDAATVVGQRAGRKTICVSTQAGCAMACVFCVTGQFGFARNLEAGEIVEQVLRFSREGRPVTNVVFMGMGEPLANYDAVVRALRLLTHPDGLRLGARRITVSTSGLVPQIRRLAGEGLQVGLAISLHAPNDALRTRLMPVNARWPIAELLAAADDYVERTGRRVSFEYTLMEGVNDSDDLAEEMGALLAGRLCHVNLIPLNPTDDPSLRAPSMERALAYEARLQAWGIATTIRVNRGQDILAACGQLRLAEKRRRAARPGRPLAESA